MTQYPTAPITEALIDIRVGEPVALETLDKICSRVADTFPAKERIFEATGKLTVEIGGENPAMTAAKNEQVGFMIKSPDGRYIAQPRRSGFSFSRLAPYENWTAFQTEAKRVWSIYREESAAAAVTRLAVRYINRIDIPVAEQIDLSDYFRTAPQLSPEIPHVLDGFLMQLQLSLGDIQSMAIINEAAIPPAREGVISVVLDIDLFRSEDLSSDEDSIWAFFELLHQRKNDLFEACITNRARELFV